MNKNEEKHQVNSDDVKTVEGDVLVMGAGPAHNQLNQSQLDRLVNAAKEQALSEVFFGPLEAVRDVESNSFYWKGPYILTGAYRREAFRTSGVTFKIPKEKEPATGMFVHFGKTNKKKDFVELRARTSESFDKAFAFYECMTRVVFMKPVVGQRMDHRTNTLIVDLGDEEVKLGIHIVNKPGWMGRSQNHFTGFTPGGDSDLSRLRCVFK